MTIRDLRLLPVFFFLAACATASPQPANDAEGAIASMNRDFMAAVAAGNVDGMMTIYAPDAVLMPPNAPPQNGVDAIRKFWSGFLTNGSVSLALHDDRVVQSCDQAAEIGHYEVTITAKGGAPIQDTGKFMLTWKRTNGQWRAIADMFSSNLPPPR